MKLFALIALVPFIAAGFVACKTQPKTPAPTPPTEIGKREAAQFSVLSWQAAHLDAALARVTDLRDPKQVEAVLRMARAANPVKQPTDADRKAADKTVADITDGKLEAAEDAAKVSAERIAVLERATQAERDARAKAEKDLADERARHAQEVADLKAQWSRNMQLWIARGFAGAGALAVAVSISAIFWAGLAAKKHIIGGILAGMVSIAVGLAVGEQWFLIAGRIVAGLLAASLLGWLIYLARTAIIERRTRLAIQDAKDEAVAGGEQAEKGWDWLKQHLMYRMPRTKTGDASLNEREIDRRLEAEGVNTTA